MTSNDCYWPGWWARIPKWRYAVKYAWGAFLALVCPTVIAGCVAHAPSPVPRASKRHEPVSLRAACLFHEKLDYVCFDRHALNLAYLGPFGKKWRGGMKADSSLYNEWVIGELHAPGHSGLPGDRAWPTKAVLEAPPGAFEGTDFLWLALSGVAGHPNSIPLSLGGYQMYVVVTHIEGANDIDELHPYMGMSIRKFIKSLERPTPVDGFFEEDPSRHVGTDKEGWKSENRTDNL